MFKFVQSAIVALVFTGSAQAQDTVMWRDNVNGWAVAIDRTIGDSCFMIAQFEDEVLLRFQVNATTHDLQFIIANIEWSTLQTGKGYDLELAFGNLDPWQGVAQGHRWNDILPSLVLSVPFSDSQAATFLEDFTENASLRVSQEGIQIAKLALSGTDEAVAEMLDCQKSMAKASDPGERVIEDGGKTSAPI